MKKLKIIGLVIGILVALNVHANAATAAACSAACSAASSAAANWNMYQMTHNGHEDDGHECAPSPLTMTELCVAGGIVVILLAMSAYAVWSDN